MRIVVKRIPIEIIELGIETYAQIDIEEILLISYPPITKTVLKFILSTLRLNSKRNIQ